MLLASPLQRCTGDFSLSNVKNDIKTNTFYLKSLENSIIFATFAA